MYQRVCWKLAFLFITAFILVFIPPTPFTFAEPNISTLPDFSSPKELTQPLNSKPTIYDGAVGIEDGHEVLYTTSKSVPAQFSVVDLETKEVLRTLPMEGANDSWQHEVAPDGTVYVTGGRYLWGYSPETKNIKQLTSIPESSLWALTVDEKNNAYIGTYPNGKVFQYNPSTDELRDYGDMIGESAQEYVRSIDYSNGFVYAGTADDQIIKLNVETGEKTRIAESLDETGTVYDLNIVDNRYVFARYKTTKNMYVYDIQQDTWLDVTLSNASGLHVASNSYQNNVYFTADNKVKYMNLHTLEVFETEMEYGSGFRGADWVTIENNEQLPGKSLATVTFFGDIVFFNPETQTVLTYDSIVPPTPNVTNTIHSYDASTMYISGMTGATGALYNPKTQEVESFSIGQGDVIHDYNGDVYFGVYPAGNVERITPSENPAGPPEELFTIGNDQQRIHAMTSGEDKLFIGSIPTYGKLGGALTVYDGTTHEVYRNIVENQSVNGLAYFDGKLYGSTTIQGGLGSTPTAEEAKLFVWDPATKKLEKEVSLDLEGLDKPEHIGELIIGKNDAYIWGASAGYIFALNPETLEVEKSKRLVQDPPMGAWNRINLEWSEDGFLYANTGGDLYVLNTETMEHKYVTNTVSFDIGEDGDIYFSPYGNRTQLSKIEVLSPDEYAWEPVTVKNSGFEQGMDFWESMFDTGTNYTYNVSTEQVYEGKQSLKVNDATRDYSVAIHSDPIPVTPNKDYLSEVMMYMNGGSPSLLIRIYDKEDNQIASEVRHVSPNYGEWQRVQQKIHAPANAAYARLFALSTRYQQTDGYYDSFALYEKVETTEQLQDITLQVEDTTLTRGQQTSYTVTAVLPNGKKEKMEDVTMYSSDNSTVKVVEDTLVGKNPGSTIIHGEVMYKETTYKTDSIDITVEVTSHSFQDYLDQRAKQGDLPRSMYKKLENQWRQVHHHKNNGRTEQARHHLSVMEKHLEKWKPEETNTKQALLIDLDYYGSQVLEEE
ncbi:carbohydrate binding domain-containing protein [Pontibacillus salicampi]|uniref:Carbohydrate binding domain-containing protein n=1 Tax=Pontibacillus salicampi TaxID=1449801 RepID=A0ABV6LQZ5_9BACI